MRSRTFVLVWLLVFPLMSFVTAPMAAAACGSQAQMDSWANNNAMTAQGANTTCDEPEPPSSHNEQASTPKAHDPYEYKLEVACQQVGAGAEVQDGTVGCYGTLIACMNATPPSTRPLTNIYRRLKGTNGAWQYVGQSCFPQSLPGAPPPPPVPTWGDIQTAFVQLPFAKPSVSMQPVGNVTLVNLPTYYKVNWPTQGLAAGDTTEPIRLLSWTVRFRISAQSYTYRFGDGSSSPVTTDMGGIYPTGKITHAYTKKGSADVKVDAVLTGEVSINGGAWEPIGTTADLQGEPVTTLLIKTAKNRLVTH